jgi:hypothetical protein
MTDDLAATGQRALEQSGSYPALGRSSSGMLYQFTIQNGVLTARSCTRLGIGDDGDLLPVLPSVFARALGLPPPEAAHLLELLGYAGTHVGVRTFQIAQKLPDTGVVDDITMGALRNAVNAAGLSGPPPLPVSSGPQPTGQSIKSIETPGYLQAAPAPHHVSQRHLEHREPEHRDHRELQHREHEHREHAEHREHEPREHQHRDHREHLEHLRPEHLEHQRAEHWGPEFRGHREHLEHLERERLEREHREREMGGFRVEPPRLQYQDGYEYQDGYDPYPNEPPPIVSLSHKFYLYRMDPTTHSWTPVAPSWLSFADVQKWMNATDPNGQYGAYDQNMSWQPMSPT